MTVRVFNTEKLKNIDFPWCDEVIHNEYAESRRWYEIWYAVYKDTDEKFYRIPYCIPATEMQEMDTFDDALTVTGTEVELREVTVMKWVEI